MLRALMEKVENMKKHISNVSGEIKNSKNKSKGKTGNTITEMKNALDGLNNTLPKAEERASEVRHTNRNF